MGRKKEKREKRREEEGRTVEVNQSTVKENRHEGKGLSVIVLQNEQPSTTVHINTHSVMQKGKERRDLNTQRPSETDRLHAFEKGVMAELCNTGFHQLWNCDDHARFCTQISCPS